MRPPTVPSWPTVYRRFCRWADAGAWERRAGTVRVEIRIEAGRAPCPAAGLRASQSTPTGSGGGTTGYDAGKTVKGRTRHRVVNTEDTVLAVSVTPANVQDPLAASEALADAQATSARVRQVWAAGRDGGRIVQTTARALDLTVTVVAPPPGQKGFQDLPRRWGIARTVAWRERYRRLARDWEAAS